MRRLFIATLLLCVGFVSKAQVDCATWTEGCTADGGYEWVLTLAPGASISFDAMTPAGAWTVVQTGTNPEVWTIYGVDPDPNSAFSFAVGGWIISGPNCTQANFAVGVDCLIDNCPNCSNPPCNIIASTPTNITCDDNGSPSDPSDDTFTFDITINETSNSGATWTSDDPLSSSGSYGASVTMGPYPISGGAFSFTVADSNNNGCSEVVNVSPPATCSNATNCVISITDNSPGACNDNGTPFDPSDDTFLLNLNATATNGGASGQFIVSDEQGNPLDTFLYGTGGMVPLPSDGNDYILTCTDLDDPACVTTVTASQSTCCAVDVTAMISPKTPADGNNGEITLCINSGSEPFDIVVSPTTNASIYPVPGTCLHNYIVAGLPEGNYDITVTDSVGCVTTLDNLDIAPPDCTEFLLAEITSANIACPGGTGSIDVTLQDPGNATSITVDLGQGIPPQTFTDLTVSPLTMSGIPAGTYNVALFDNNGCEVTYLYNPISIQEADPLPSIHTFPTNTSSTVVADGTISVCFDGDPGSTYTVTTNPPAGVVMESTGDCLNNFIISELPAGSYEVIVEDEMGCVSTGFAIVNDPTCPISLIPTDTTHIICHGDSTGTFSASVLDGVAPYSISWDGGATFGTPQANPDFTIDNLPEGEHAIIVMDANGCQQTFSGMIPVSATPAITLESTVTNVSTFGGSDGSIALCINGGALEYDIAISPDTGVLTDLGGSNICEEIHLLNSLSGGIYEITITDTLGCSEVFEVEVLAPTCPGFLIDDVVVDSVSCHGDTNGSITVSLSGGAAPYTYNLSNGVQSVTTTATSYTFDGLTVGEYDVWATDANGCFVPIPEPVEVLQPGALKSIIVSIPPCEGEENGVICLTPLAGTAPPYTYNIFNTDDPDVDLPVMEGSHPECGGEFYLENIGSGSYHVELVDEYGCIAHTVHSVGSVSVQASAQIAPDCTGASVGAIDLSAGGATPPYNYEWSNGVMDEDLTGLEQGNYTVTITDNRGCTNISSFDVGLSDLSLNFAVAETCVEQDAGAIITAVTNGVPQYTFEWDNGTTTNNETISGLALGDYAVTVTDFRGCTAIGGATVTEYDMVADMVVENTCVGQSNGFVGATVAQGIPNFTFAWSDGTDGGVITDLAPGDYSVTITDVNGCTAVGNATVEEYNLVPTLDVTDVCAGGDVGTITATVENLEAPANYVWSDGSVGNPIGNLPAGDYTMTVTDALGCEVTASATVNEFESPVAVASNDISIEQGESGNISVSASGGSGPYTYQWVPATVDSPNSENTNASPFETTTYTVIVTDANGCTAEDEVTITVVPPVILVMPNAFSPNGDQDNEIFEPFVPNANADIQVFQVFDRWGKMIHDDPTSGWDGKFNNKEQPVGTYVYVVEYLDLLGRKESLKGHFNLVR